MPQLVDYAYIAEKLNVSQQTVRVYATGTKQRKAGFPKSALPEGARSPLFHTKDADAFIKRRLEATAGDSDQEEAAQNTTAELGRELNLRSSELLQPALFGDHALPHTDDPSLPQHTPDQTYPDNG